MCFDLTVRGFHVSFRNEKLSRPGLSSSEIELTSGGGPTYNVPTIVGSHPIVNTLKTTTDELEGAVLIGLEFTGCTVMKRYAPVGKQKSPAEESNEA